MPLIYVHVCSRCGVREETSVPSRLSGWAAASVVTQNRYGDDHTENFDWCGDCWSRIKTKFAHVQPGGQI